MSKQLLHWRGRVPKTKALNPPPLVLSQGQLQQVGKTDSAGTEIPWLDMASTSNTSVHALKKCCLQIKPGSGLYTAMEFHTLTIVNIILSNELPQKNYVECMSGKYSFSVFFASFGNSTLGTKKFLGGFKTSRVQISNNCK